MKYTENKDRFEKAHVVKFLTWKNPIDRGAWWATVHGVAKIWTQLKEWSVHECAGGSEHPPFYFLLRDLLNV